jgi:hypothetical protein
MFLYTTESRTALGLTQSPIQWVPGALSLRVKQQEREADYSPPPSAEVRMRGAIPPLPQYAFMAWCSAKAQGQLYFLPYVFVTPDLLFSEFFIANFR